MLLYSVFQYSLLISYLEEVNHYRECWRFISLHLRDSSVVFIVNCITRSSWPFSSYHNIMMIIWWKSDYVVTFETLDRIPQTNIMTLWQKQRQCIVSIRCFKYHLPSSDQKNKSHSLWGSGLTFSFSLSHLACLMDPDTTEVLAKAQIPPWLVNKKLKRMWLFITTYA